MGVLMDRLTWLATREGRAAARPSGPSLAEALADRDIAVVRIRARFDARQHMWHDLAAWTQSYRRVFFDPASHDADQAQRQALIAWYFELHPTVDWSRDHQIVVATGEVQSAPDAWEDGWMPEEEMRFGGAPAIYLPAGRTWADAPEPTYPLPRLERAA